MQWQQNLPHGHGVAVRPGEATFLGGFKAGMLHGIGTVQYSNGDCYAGESLHGLWHGHGLLQLADRSHYAGGFQQVLPHSSLHFADMHSGSSAA